MVGNLKNRHQNSVQMLAYCNFIIRKKYRVDSVAKKWGIHKDTLYRKIRGESPFYVDEIPKLVEATEDIEYLEYLADLCGYSLIPKIKDKYTAKMFYQMARVMQSAINLKEKE